MAINTLRPMTLNTINSVVQSQACNWTMWYRNTSLLSWHGLVFFFFFFFLLLDIFFLDMGEGYKGTTCSHSSYSNIPIWVVIIWQDSLLKWRPKRHVLRWQQIMIVFRCKQNLDIRDLQRGNYYHLLSDFSSKFQPFMTIFHYQTCTIHRLYVQ